MSITTVSVRFERWLAADEHDLAYFVRRSIAELRAVAAG